MNTLFILQRKLICELYYISVYFILLFFLMKRVLNAMQSLVETFVGLCLPSNYLNIPWQEIQKLSHVSK